MQDRSVLFFKRENTLLASIFSRCQGQLALVYGPGTRLDLKAIKMPFVFRANEQKDPKQDVCFAAHEWPLPVNFFDVLVLDHPLEQKGAIAALIAEAKKVLRSDGVLVVTGRNRKCLFAWPRYSILKVLSVLEQHDFSCKTYRFDICRSQKLNRILEKIVPFLSMGFVIEARIDSISLTPLQEEKLSLLMERLIDTPPATASRVMKKVEHES